MLGELYQAAGATPELFHKFIMNSSSEMSKASRRKQSKPNRLLANEEGGPQLPSSNQQTTTSPRSSPQNEQGLPGDSIEHNTEDKDPMDLSTKATSPAATPIGSMGNESSPSPSNAEPNAVSPGEMQMVNFPCHTCGEVFSSRALQEQHMMEKHISDSASTKTSPPGPIFPSVYHRLATDLGLNPMGSGLMPPLSAAKPMSESSKALVAAAANGVGIPKPGTPGVGGKGTAGTVFQREAYCEICQREFCNKYFLKTHKANIHGIIDPNDPKSAAVAAKINQAPKVNHVSSPESLMSQKTTGSVSKSTNIDNMDDFCEICQKHFCNKYYLKKHKVDVHNIRPDGSKPPLSAADGQNDGRSLPPGVPVSNTLPLPMMVPPLNSLNPSSMSNMLFVNPFVPSMAAMSMVPPIMQHQFFMPGVGGLAAAHAASQVTSSTSPEIKSEQRSNSGSEKGDSKSQAEKTEAFCNICKKEFCNSYFLQVHKASKHGIFEDPAALMMMAAEREKLEREGQMKTPNSPSPNSVTNTIRPVVLTSDKDRAKTFPAFALNATAKTTANQPMMGSIPFDAMMAAKQADRITCDICNKEVCNKYFLKAHKLKMHGVSSPDEKSNNPNAKDNEVAKRTPSQLGNEAQPGPDATTPESLAKIGIDPEAYCFLCKKEFCSKYFLRTHKLNIHGIKSDETQQRAIKEETTTPISTSPVSTQSFQPALSSVEMYQWRLKDQIQTKGLPPTLNDLKSGGSDKFTWRWKESANSTRVFCDICNKELCNKYFLRTHKLNIHGISDSLSPTKTNRSLTASSMMADLVRASQSNVQNTSASPNHDGGSGYGAMRTQSPQTPSQSSSPSAMDKADSMRDDVCQVCGMVFPDSDAVNDHIKLEHSDENMEVLYSNTQLQNEDGEQVYSCSQCTYKTSILSNIYSHEARKHNADLNTCKTCQVTFSHINMLVKHMRQIHKKHISTASLKRAAGEIVEKTAKRKIQCNYCHEKFLSKQLCQSHIRNAHTNRAHVTNKLSDLKSQKVYACDRCRYTCRSVRNLRRHQAMKHKSKYNSSKNHSVESNGRCQQVPNSHSSAITMQEFTIQGVNGIDSLATQTINLPVYHQITDKVQVSLTLIPSVKSTQQECGENSDMDTATS